MAVPLPLFGQETAVKTASDLPPLSPLQTFHPLRPRSLSLRRRRQEVPPKSPAQPVHSSATIASPAPAATLDVEVDHKFAEAHLSIWVDGNLSYTRTLEGTDKKRLAVFHHVKAMKSMPCKSHLERIIFACSHLRYEFLRPDRDRGFRQWK